MTHDQECALRHVQRDGWCPGCDDASARREARGMEVRLRERRSPDRLSERYVPWWYYAALALGWLYICVASAIQGEVWGAVGSAAVVVILVVIAVGCYGDTKKVDDLPITRLRERIMIGPLARLWCHLRGCTIQWPDTCCRRCGKEWFQQYQAPKYVTPEHDAAVAAEWADHFEVCQGMVGTERLTVESMIASLRGPRPFGRMAGESDADA